MEGNIQNLLQRKNVEKDYLLNHCKIQIRLQPKNYQMPEVVLFVDREKTTEKRRNFERTELLKIAHGKIRNAVRDSMLSE